MENTVKAGERAVAIDGQRFLWSELSADARAQFDNLRALDEHIAQLQRLIAICEAAESAYLLALRVALDEHNRV